MTTTLRPLRRLTVLYDASCGFCVRCRHWLEREPRHVALEFVPARSELAARRFPGLRAGADELVVVSDPGEVYRADKAFIMCLWALRRHRARAMRLARPASRALARTVFATLSANRGWLSRLFGSERDEACASGSCGS